MSPPTIDESHRPESVRLYVRNDAPFVARDRVREVETRLQSAGLEVTVAHWGRRIPWDEDHASHVRYERFLAWAADAGVTLEPAFHRTCHTSQYTGESTEVLIPPVVTLVAYGTSDIDDHDGFEEPRPLAVYPHHDGSTPVSVEAGLAAIERACAVQPL
jgi:hypothetical protein